MSQTKEKNEKRKSGQGTIKKEKEKTMYCDVEDKTVCKSHWKGDIVDETFKNQQFVDKAVFSWVWISWNKHAVSSKNAKKIWIHCGGIYVKDLCIDRSARGNRWTNILLVNCRIWRMDFLTAAFKSDNCVELRHFINNDISTCKLWKV